MSCKKEVLIINSNNHSYLLLYKTWLDQRGRASGTMQEYEYNIIEYLKFLALKDAREATKADIDLFIAKLYEKGNKQRTRNRKLLAVRSFYKWMVDTERITENPTLKVELAKITEDKKPTYLEPEEWQEFIKEIPKTKYERRNLAMCSLMVEAGLRISEISALNAFNVNHEELTIDVLGKGGKERSVPITAELAELLRRVVKENKTPPKSRLKLFEINGDKINYNTNPALFQSRHRKRISRRRIQQITEEVFDKLKNNQELTPEQRTKLNSVPLTSHKLRHTFGTNAIRAKVPLPVLQELLGHTNIATTQIYIHVDMTQKRDAINDLHEHLNKGNSSK